VKSLCSPISGRFPVIPAQAGIQGFQTFVLGPRFRGDDDFGWTAEFSQSLEVQDPVQTYSPAIVCPRAGRRPDLWAGMTTHLISTFVGDRLLNLMSPRATSSNAWPSRCFRCLAANYQPAISRFWRKSWAADCSTAEITAKVFAVISLFLAVFERKVCGGVHDCRGKLRADANAIRIITMLS
jgi:hypothetical protein